MAARNQSKAGASRAEVESAVRKFLGSPDLNVLAVKGTWGIGKTYLIKTLLETDKISHYYGSLFGLASLGQLKGQLFANFRSLDSSKSKDVYRHLGQLAGRFREVFRRIPGVGTYLPLTEELLFSAVKNSVVCLDDIERKIETLSMAELLGFVSHLTEERSCKVIIILNEEHFFENSADKDSLDRYREKVVDAEVRLAPGFEENSGIVFNAEAADDQIILGCLSGIGVVNIRLMKRISSIAEEFRRYTREWDEVLRSQFLRNLTVIALARYQDGFIVGLSDLPYDLPPLRSLDPDVKEQMAARRIYYDLRRMGYSSLPTDTCVIDFVNNLAYDEDLLVREGRRLNEQETANKVLSEVQRIWLLYGESFAPNGPEIGKKIQVFVDKHLSALDLRQFYELKLLGEAVGVDISKYETRLLEETIDRCPEVFLESLNAHVEGRPELKRRLEGRRQQLAGNRDITSVLLSIADRHTWEDKDSAFLNGHNKEEIGGWLLAGHPNLPLMIKWGLNIGGEFSKNLKGAIVELAGISDLNRMRAEDLHHLLIEEASIDTSSEKSNERSD